MVLPRGEKGKKEAALAWIQRRALLWWWWRGWRRPRDDPARKTTVAVLLLSQCLSQPVFGSPNCKEEGKVRNAHQRLYQGPLDAWYRPNKVAGEWVSLCIYRQSCAFRGVILDYWFVTSGYMSPCCLQPVFPLWPDIIESFSSIQLRTPHDYFLIFYYFFTPRTEQSPLFHIPMLILNFSKWSSLRLHAWMPLAHSLFVAVNEQMKIVPIQVADERDCRLWFCCGTVS